MVDESITVAVRENRLDYIEKSLDDHRNDFKEFKKDNDVAHEKVQHAITGLQRIVYGAIGIIGFLSFAFQALPVISDMIAPQEFNNVN